MPCDLPAAVVFVGPSIRAAGRPAIAGVAYRPPVRRGDLAALAGDPERPALVGIIDGEFDQSLAVSPREVLGLLRLGVAVYGASSMGALRAAELHTLGMIGIGRVFELFRDEVVTAEDEVAILFDPASELCLTEPLVNVRCALDHCVARGQLTAELAARLVALAAALPYPERTYRRLARAAASELGADLELLLPALRAHDQKQLDGLALIDAVARRLAASDPITASPA
jgi:hypothetical protein